MAPTKTLPIVDRVVPGGLRDWLGEARAKRETYGAIALRLASEFGVVVSAQTVSNWCQELEIGKGEL